MICSNPDCQVAENGSCLQGHNPVQSCPSFGKPLEPIPDISVDEEKLETEIEQTTTAVKLELSSGQPLTQREVDLSQLRRSGRLIAIVGDTSSGKSTLICSIYDCFLRGPFANRTFAESATLNAFELLAHLSRSTSGASSPDTKRTSLSEGLHYYHLATSTPSKTGSRHDLFMSDRAGENYKSGMNKPELLKDMPELAVARVVAVLIDGARLSQREEQHEVLDSARRIVRSMIDANALNSSQHLQVVLTKRDEVALSQNPESTVQSLRDLVTRLNKQFGKYLSSITFHEISARDPRGKYSPAHGCDALLKSWIGAADPCTHQVAPSIVCTAQFDRLADIGITR